MTVTQHYMHTNPILPLAGVRVLDLSRVLAGPLSTLMLADLGADVIKVERAGGGDETRRWGPPFNDAGESAYFLSVNRNKLSVTVDFAERADRELLHTLAASADVVVENFLPGALAKYGLDADGMLIRNERLLWCTISGFGPESTRPGYDFVLQAESGWMAITGPEQGPPYKAGVAFADIMAGKDAAIAILSALVGRSNGRSPLNRKLHISLRGSATAALMNVAQNALLTGTDAGRWGNAHPNLAPYQLFDAADRPLVLAVGSDAQWQAAARALELPELAADGRLATNAGRLAERARVVEAISARIVGATAGYWVERLGRAGVPCGLVRTVLEALADVSASPAWGVAPATGGQVRRLPPRLGEHAEIIRKMHWSAFGEVPILG